MSDVREGGKQDSFYRGLTPEEMEDVAEYNFDHPGTTLTAPLDLWLC